MLELSLIAGITVLVIGLHWAHRTPPLQLRAASRVDTRQPALARALDLEPTEPRSASPFGGPAQYPHRDLMGTHLGARVRISWARDDDAIWTEISIHGAPADLDLELPLTVDSTDRPLIGPDLEDPALLGALGSRAHDRLARARAAGARRARIAHGALHCRVPGHLDHAGPLEDLLIVGRVLVDALSPHHVEIDNHLAEQALHDPSPAHRARCLRALRQRDAALARAVATDALQDPSHELRLQAALYLEHAPALVALAAEVDAPSPLRIRALRGLYGAEAPAREAIRTLLDSPRPRLRIAALEAVAQVQADDLIPALMGVERGSRARWGDATDEPVIFDEVAVALAETLARLGSAAAQPLLLELLAIDDIGVRRAALEALGKVGTPAALPAIESWTGPGRLALGPTARQAIAAIEARGEPAEAGALSLAEGEHGALSLSADAGALSLADGRSLPGAVSEPDEDPG